MPQRYTIAKGDIFLKSNHADESFVSNDGFVMFFYNTPKEGKALVVDYTPCDRPSVYIYITANWKARLYSRTVQRNSNYKKGIP